MRHLEHKLKIGLNPTQNSYAIKYSQLLPVSQSALERMIKALSRPGQVYDERTIRYLLCRNNFSLKINVSSNASTLKPKKKVALLLTIFD